MIVGVDKYDAERYANLRDARADADRIAKFLGKDLPEEQRFRVRLFKNPDASDVAKFLEKILSELDDDSIFVFYFSGHGLCHRASGKRLLLCSDAFGALADGFDGLGALTLDYMRAFSQRGKGNMFFCYDVCRKEVEAGHKGDSDAGGANDFRDATSTPPDVNLGGSGRRWSLSSCEDGKLARDDGSFVTALLAEMQESLTERGEIRLGDELVTGVTRRLRKMRNLQQPEPKGLPFVLATNADVARPRVEPIPTRRQTRRATDPFPLSNRRERRSGKRRSSSSARRSAHCAGEGRLQVDARSL